MDIPIRKAPPGEAKEFAAFSEACFIESFGYLFPEQALDHLCRRAFAPEAAAALIDRGAWIAEGPAGWAGYAALAPEACPVQGLPEPHLQLARLYVAGPRALRGLRTSCFPRSLTLILNYLYSIGNPDAAPHPGGERRVSPRRTEP